MSQTSGGVKTATDTPATYVPHKNKNLSGCSNG